MDSCHQINFVTAYALKSTIHAETQLLLHSNYSMKYYCTIDHRQNNGPGSQAMA